MRKRLEQKALRCLRERWKSTAEIQKLLTAKIAKKCRKERKEEQGNELALRPSQALLCDLGG
jgi:hypothetical protein